MTLAVAQQSPPLTLTCLSFIHSITIKVRLPHARKFPYFSRVGVSCISPHLTAISNDVYHPNFLSQLSYKVYHDNRNTLKLCVPPCSKSTNDKGN